MILSQTVLEIFEVLNSCQTNEHIEAEHIRQKRARSPKNGTNQNLGPTPLFDFYIRHKTFNGVIQNYCQRHIHFESQCRTDEVSVASSKTLESDSRSYLRFMCIAMLVTYSHFDLLTRINKI